MYSRLREVKKILYKHHILFWPDCGTLLFMYRDDKLDPTDIDISIPYAYRQAVLESIEDFIKNGYHIHAIYEYKNKITEVSMRKNGLAVDLFLRQRKGSYLVGYSNYGFEVAWGQPYKHFQCMSSMIFDGNRYKIPSEIEKYLAYTFGKDWQIPRQKWDSSKDSPCINERWL